LKADNYLYLKDKDYLENKDYLEDMDYLEDKDRMTKAHCSP
jgi:hypothetical protein